MKILFLVDIDRAVIIVVWVGEVCVQPIQTTMEITPSQHWKVLVSCHGFHRIVIIDRCLLCDSILHKLLLCTAFMGWVDKLPWKNCSGDCVHAPFNGVSLHMFTITNG